MQAFAAGALISGAAIFCIGCGVLLQVRHDLVRRLFFFFCCGLSLWSASLGLLFMTHRFFYNQFIFYAGFAIFCGLFLFVCAYPKKSVLPRWYYAATLPGACIAALAYWDPFVSTMTAGQDGSLSPVNGPLMPLYFCMCGSYFLVSMGVFASRFKTSCGHERLQWWYLLAALILSSGAIVIFDVALPAVGIFALIALGPMSLAAFSGLMAYAIVRHQLMDIRFVLQRGLIYSALAVLVIACYIAVLHIVGIFLGGGSSHTLWSALITTFIGVITAPYIERRFRELSDPIFYKDTYDYADALRRLSECLSSSLIAQELAHSCERTLADILKAEKVAILTESGEVFGAAILVPIVVEGSVIATIAVSDKRSGDAYTKEDRHLLDTFALQAATAFGRAALYARVSKHAEELEEKVAERTRELTRLHEEQRKFALDISHNLQTPLAVFQTKLEQLKRTVKDDEVIASLEHSLEDLSVFISDYLRLARMEQQADSAYERLDLSALLEGILEEIEIIAEDHGIRISSDIAPGIVVVGDEARVREVTLGLASNAIKYMCDDGERTIHFSLVCEGQSAVLSVRDSGVGIAAQDLPHIFERFWRAKHTEGIAGSGLGLSLAKHIVERHGGTIAVASALGEGTTVMLRLPRA